MKNLSLAFHILCLLDNAPKRCPGIIATKISQLCGHGLRSCMELHDSSPNETVALVDIEMAAREHEERLVEETELPAVIEKQRLALIDEKEKESAKSSVSVKESHETHEDEPTTSKTDKQKIDILLKAVGDAPIMKKKKWSVDKDKDLGSILQFVKKYLGLEPSESLFLYVNQCFAPTGDQTIGNLYDCFGSDGKLILHYSRGPAWG